MRPLGLAILLLLAAIWPAPAAPILFGSKEPEAERLVVWSATDLDRFQPLIEVFVAEHPGLAIEYHDMQSRELYEKLRDEARRDSDETVPDLAISSAADLQIKLVNDGFAQAHEPPADAVLPPWSNWRNQAFGFSAEPAVIVYNRQLGALGALPRTRLDLAAFIRKNDAALRGKVATYDIGESGIGYLFASEDSFYSSTFTTLMQTFGQAEAKTYCCSGQMLDLLANGTLQVGYNILGSYALARLRSGAPIEIVLPQDYTLILARVALIPAAARRPDLGGAFLDFLLSPRAQALMPGLADYQAVSYRQEAGFTAHPIALSPALLVFLDELKQARFIRAWRGLLAKAQ